LLIFRGEAQNILFLFLFCRAPAFLSAEVLTEEEGEGVFLIL
jgi:hypothetical protein